MKVAVEFEVRDLNYLRNVISLGIAHGLYMDEDVKVVDSIHADERHIKHGGVLKTLRHHMNITPAVEPMEHKKVFKRKARKHTTIVG